MSVKKILQNISRINSQFGSVNYPTTLAEPCARLYIEEYKELAQPFDEGILSNIDLKHVANFLADYNEYLYYQLGYRVVLYNVPKQSVLKYETTTEIVTPEHIFDTVKEIDKNIKLVAQSPADAFFIVCENDERVSELLDGKLIGKNLISAKCLKRTAEKFTIRDEMDSEPQEQDLCTSAIVVSFFISLAFLLAIHTFFYP